MKENYGNLTTLLKLGETKRNSFTTEQLLDEKLKNTDGENRIEVTERMEKTLNCILTNNSGKNIAIVSHGASIKFLLMKWCNLNSENQLEYCGKVLRLNSPGILKLLFNKRDLINIVQILSLN